MYCAHASRQFCNIEYTLIDSVVMQTISRYLFYDPTFEIKLEY